MEKLDQPCGEGRFVEGGRYEVSILSVHCPENVNYKSTSFILHVSFIAEPILRTNGIRWKRLADQSLSDRGERGRNTVPPGGADGAVLRIRKRR